MQEDIWAELHATMIKYVQEYVGKIRRVGEVDDIENGIVTLATVHCKLLSYLMSLCSVARGHGQSQELARFVERCVVSWLAAAPSTNPATRDH